MRTAAVKGEMNMAQKVQKVRSKLEKKGYSGIECTEVGKCIRLEGEMTEWTDIVKAGKAAAKFGYKGVLNDISLKGFTEPAIRAPKFTEGSLEGAQPDVLIIGGGVIGIEFATFYADLGCEVTVIEGMDRLLPNMDKELGQSLALILKKQGVKVFTNAMVQSVEKTGEDIAVNFTCKEKSETVSGEAVLCAIGRRPYCDGLFADGISVEMNRRSIAVNERYETSIPHIYAIGDVSAKIQLAHVATAQGIACVDLLYGRENHTSMSVVPSCIYCRPEIAVVGLTEAEAKEAGIPVKVGKHVMFDNAKTLIADPGRCFMKFVAHAETRELLGAQLMCKHASDMIGGVSQALANHMTADQFLLAIRPHPSFEEAMTAALEDLAQKLG